MSEIDDLLGLEEDDDEIKGIPINDKYRIENLDQFNLVVKEKYYTKATDDKPSEEAWRPISYHANLEQAFKSITDKEINFAVDNGLSKVIEKIEELKSFKNCILGGKTVGSKE